jgi:hypothetical protein
MDRKERGGEGLDWVNAAQDKENWRAQVNMIMKFRVYGSVHHISINENTNLMQHIKDGAFKLFKRPFPGLTFRHRATCI